MIFASCTKVDTTSQNSQELLSSSKSSPNVIACDPGYHFDNYLKKCVANCPTGYHNDSITGSCVLDGGNTPIIISYAGVNISYYTNSHILGFKDSSDFNTVLNQLDSDYESYNTNYENQYPNLSDIQLDSLDSVKNFDQLKTYKDFEAKFGGYTSQKSIFDNNETTWLNNSMSGADPDSLDYTVDNSENAICNSNYQFIVAGTTYKWTSTGCVVVGGAQTSVVNSPTATCYTNYKLPLLVYSTDRTRRCKLKVAVTSFIFRGGAKTKVKSFRRKSNGKWQHSRIDLQANLAGPLNDGRTCGPWLVLNDSKHKKRTELKILDRQSWWGAYIMNNNLQGSFNTTISGLSGTIVLH